MTKKQCPLGEDCDLTLAWMMGAEDARDKAMVRIAALEDKLAKAEVIVCIIASAEFDERIGEAVDLSCEYLAGLEGENDE